MSSLSTLLGAEPNSNEQVAVETVGEIVGQIESPQSNDDKDETTVITPNVSPANPTPVNTCSLDSNEKFHTFCFTVVAANITT